MSQGPDLLRPITVPPAAPDAQIRPSWPASARVPQVERTTAQPDIAQPQVSAIDHLLFVINVLGLGLAGLDALLDLGPWSAYACVLITSTLYLLHVSWRATPVLVRLLVFGVMGGLTELAADWWLVSVTNTLHYAPWGPFLVDSPAYMPLSWAGILLSMGFLGYSVQLKYGMWAGTAVATLVTGLYVPVFEALAHYAGWWTYSGCPMLGVVPWYIIVGEALVGALLTLLVTRALQSRSIWGSVGLGAVAGVWIWVAYYIAMLVT